ncbi:winged helix family transcriptional regulator [Streptomyces sp. AJS327]|uniref:winged helix-turn-helix domain-containing protein n=1 Tax=Streptomyces sp. AJS327 TaxID=2545265 RepID=UPI0015E041F5|nr:winged helix-turn-helix domain-containing protein [Streptomyces sp. AJS327]MBA0053395.1 winged helix family transcriptional regulator [Streptomyces sp. AJS327]
MTPALPTETPTTRPERRRLRVVRQTPPVVDTPPAQPGDGDGARATVPPGRPTGEEDGTPLVGYLVLVPEGTDPTQLFTLDGVEPEFRTVTYTGALPNGDQPPLPYAGPPTPTGAPASPPAGGRDVTVDPERRTAAVDGRPLDLTYLEFELLTHLLAHPHRVHSREHLVAAIWGHEYVGDGRTVDVHIARLRRKLGAPYRRRVVTVRRVGYKYLPDPA